MALPIPPEINQGQIALDPVNGIVYYKDADGNLVSTTWSWLRDDTSNISTDDEVLIDSNLTVSGDLVIQGDTVTLNTSELLIEDNFIILNSNVTGSPILNAGIEIERGTSPNVFIRWNESVDQWQITVDGTNYYNVLYGDQQLLTTSDVIFNSVTADIIGDVTGNITGDLTGDVTGDLTGNVTGDLTGDVTGTVSDISNHGISDLSDVAINDAENGDFLRYNGSSWINDPVNLTSDTVGDYVARLAAGTGITITNNSGEGSTPNIAFSGSIDNLSDVVITSVANGQILEFNGTNWVNTVSASSEPMGHEDKSQSTMSFNESTRIFSIAPVSSSFTVWCKGKRYVKTTALTVTIPDTSGTYYISFNASGDLQYTTTFFDLENETPTAYVYWNQVDDKAYFFADERHGIVLDWQTHEYLHRTRGAAIANGFGASGFTITGNGSLNTDAQISIADGTFFDEDLEVNITHSATPTANTWQQYLQGPARIPAFYRLNNHWTRDNPTDFPLKQGTSLPQYNLNTAGTWSTVDLSSNKFGGTWIIATNNLNYPIIAIIGQAEYNTIGEAESDAVAWDNLDLSGFPIFEFRPLYKVIYQVSTGYANTPNAKFVSVVDIRVANSGSLGVPAVAVNDHGLLTGLADDDHTQYLRTDGTRTATSLTVSGSITTNSFILDGIEIDAATPSDTNVLKYDAGLNKYVPGAASTVASLDDLTDVIISGATPNQILKFNGTNWVNAESTSGGSIGSTFSAAIGDGSETEYILTHNFSTRNIVVSITEENAPYGAVSAYWEATDLDNITIYFASPPASDSIRVNVYGSVSGTLSSSYAETIGNVTDTTYTIDHNLGTRDIILQARNVDSPYESYNVAWEATTIDRATVYFDNPPGEDSVRIKVIS